MFRSMSEKSSSSALILSIFSLKNVVNLFARSSAELYAGNFVIFCRKRRLSIIFEIASESIPHSVILSLK